MKIKTLFIIFLGTLFYYLPIFINPNLLLSRGNDLEEVFWPVFYFIRDSFLRTGDIPLWNNLFLSGTPLLPDPQFSMFYPLNLLFIIFPTDPAFIIYFFIHTFFAGLAAFLLAQNGFKFSYLASLFTSLLYIFTPKAAGFLEAGHYGLFATLTWVPFVVLAVLKLSKDPKISWTILLAISLAGLFYTHTIIFLISIIATPILYAILLILEWKLFTKKSLLLILLSFILTFGLISVTLLPQLEWMPDTTRFLLLQDRDVYPKWIGKKEFLEMSVAPWLFNISELQKIDSEKWIMFGTINLMLALFGFWKVSRRLKITISIASLIIILITLNNASPVYSWLISQDWFVLMRVSTRLWIIIVIIVAFLAGYGLDRLMILKNKKIVCLIAFIALTESLFLGYIRLQTPIPKGDNFVPDEVYEFLSQDKDHFRVYCTTRCIPQKQAAIHRLELIDGYNTLQQKNFYQQAWQLTGGYWNYYTLSIPPVGLYTFNKLQPDSISLGNYNTKYVISPHALTNKSFILEARIAGFSIYKNNDYRARAYYLDRNLEPANNAAISFYSSNHIRVNTDYLEGNKLILSEIYNKDWVAYQNGYKEIPIAERPDGLRFVNIYKQAKYIDFKFESKSYRLGRLISGTTILILFLYLINQSLKRNEK